jgi:hypothetical protein
MNEPQSLSVALGSLSFKVEGEDSVGLVVIFVACLGFALLGLVAWKVYWNAQVKLVRETMAMGGKREL